jgi:integrase
MATIKKRRWQTSSGEFREAWRVSYTDGAGQRHHKQFNLRRDADAYRIKVEGEIAHGVHTPDASSLTISEAADVWIATCEAGGCDRGTLKTYREIVNVHIRPHLGGEKLSRLSAPRVVQFRDGLMATRSHTMASKAVRHLSMILGEAMRRGLVAQNVARSVKVKKPRQETPKLARRAEIPPQEHLRRMLEAADLLRDEDPRLPVLLRLVMLTGLRASEARGLSWSGVDLTVPSVRVSQRADRWNEIGAPKSNAGHRSIPIGPALRRTLKEWKVRCPPSELRLVFPNWARGRPWPSKSGQTNGQPIDQGRFAALLLKTQVAAGLAIDTGKRDGKDRAVWQLRYDWHHLRHVAASNWINDGVDLKRLQTWIGHENIQLTIDVYGHLIRDAKKDAALAAGAEAALLP